MKRLKSNQRHYLKIGRQLHLVLLQDVLIADLNGDGLKDVLASGRFRKGLWLFLGRGGIQQLNLGSGFAKLPLSLSAGDLDGDKDLDLAVFDGESVKILTNEQPPVSGGGPGQVLEVSRP